MKGEEKQNSHKLEDISQSSSSQGRISPMSLKLKFGDFITLDSLNMPGERCKIEDCYIIHQEQLEGRQVLGHINPITLRFISLTNPDGSQFYEPRVLDAYLDSKVLFAFIEEDNLEKMLILSTFDSDGKHCHQLAAQRLIIGSIDAETNRFVPDVFPGPGFFDWESFYQNKRGIFCNFDSKSGQIEPYFVESEHDYELNKTLNKKMAVLGHIDTISRKFVPKKKNGHRVKIGVQKLKNVAVTYIDSKYPGIQIVVTLSGQDYELEQKIKQTILIRGKIDPFHLYFKPTTNLKAVTIYPNERLLKKDCILGYMNPYTQEFVWKHSDSLLRNKEDKFVREIIPRKVLIAHIDSKAPELGYVIVQDTMDNET